ncbi:glycosyltransferase family 2 protein [Candidatus Microgenomates bacterium]|nr:glycosyltransferase family 2 protein [Candidatus Microgenomates bacterium]
MKVSIIIPTYNEEQDILSCLNSLNKQTFRNFEVIVVDDGSTDNTLKKLRSAKSNKLEIVTQKHLGAGAGRNLGASKATGKILVFVDADMTFHKNFIKNLIKPIIQGKSKGTFSKNEIVSNWHNVWAKCWNINEGWEPRKRHPKIYPDTQEVFRAILRSEFDSVGGFTPGGYNDDWSLSKKLGYKATSTKGAIFYHKNPDSLKEIFHQAKWVGKREYKLGPLGYLLALIRVSLPMSILIGLYKSVVNWQIQFLIFKIVYDFGAFLGIVSYILNKKGAK